MQVVSVLSLSLLGALCLGGVFSHKYRDNWLQFAGLWGVMLWAFARAWQVASGAGLTEQQLWAHVSMTLYAAGTAVKVWSYPKSERQPDLWWRMK